MAEISEDFIEARVEQLKSQDDVKAVAIVGSVARGDEEHNDLDIFVIVDDNWRQRVTKRIDGVVVEKFFNSMSFAKKYLEKDDWWYSYHWFKNADVRYDPEDLFSELRSYAEKMEKDHLNLSDEDREKIRYTIWDLLQELDEKDVGQKRYNLFKLFDYLLEKIFVLNDIVPVKENYRMRKLKEFDGYMYKLAQEFLTTSSTLEKQAKIEKMVDHVARDVGEPQPHFETSRERGD